MKFNQMTYHISLALLGLTAVYLLMYSGMTGILLVAAATMISAAFLDSVEMVTAVCVVSALLYVLVFKRYIKHLEPFQDSAASIKSRIGSIQQKYSQKGQPAAQQPQGVYHKSVEGFADVSSEKKEGAPSESSSATQIVPQVDSEEVKRVTAAVDHAENEDKSKDEEKAADKKIAKEDFQSATNGLFKLGQMPSENTGGPHLDAGSTIMKAMSSFDKNTVSAMTADTKKLLETQKGLMSMLNEMRPVLKDGKELLETFSGMFGGNSGAANMLFSM
jgi:hypothetical protein